MTEPYKYQSLADAYESIYESARTVNKMAPHGVHTKPDINNDKQNKRVATSYAEVRNEKLENRKAATLKVEAADLAYVINALIEDGTITPDRVKQIMTEKTDPKRMNPERMARYRTPESEEIRSQMEMAKNKGKRTPAQKAVTRAAVSDERTPAQKTVTQKTVTQQMADATGPRPGSRYRGD